MFNVSKPSLVAIRSGILHSFLLGVLVLPPSASALQPATLLLLPSLVLDGVQLAVSDTKLAVDSRTNLTLQAFAYCATDSDSELIVLLSAPRSQAGPVRLESMACTANTKRLAALVNSNQQISHIVSAQASVKGRHIVLAPMWVISGDGQVTKLPPGTPPLASIPLTGLNISTGDREIGPLSLTVAFHEAGILIATALTEAPVPHPRGRDLVHRDSGLTSGLARVPVRLLNRVLEETSPNTFLEGDMGRIKLIDLRFGNLVARQGASLSGQAIVSGTAFPFLLTFSGDNLSLKEIVISPPDNRCGPEPHGDRDWMAWALCSARHTVAEQVAATLSATLTSRYRGEFLYPVSPGYPLVIRKQRSVLSIAIVKLRLHPLDEALFAAVQAIPIAVR